ncbi:PREDICTED: uncharacterized protein LOC104591314 [Nelumbo nucifera]|uniref:Uncharacterized protein LOC104591314 n=1 Tax=Nelumbo nucifera TaxID=4432 RepID=A0A1U8Q0P6_NELNU|nr:PREDICTED: uncharacterized protein LOC104591314 [Nelumbo nucifera]
MLCKADDGASLVISYSQGREVVEKQRQQYSDVVISDLPDRLTLKKVAANHSFEIAKFEDEPGFYFAVLKYIFGKNSSMEKIPMTTPVFTRAVDADLSKVSIQIVLSLEKDLIRIRFRINAGTNQLTHQGASPQLSWWQAIPPIVEAQDQTNMSAGSLCLPDPNKEALILRKVEGGIVAVLKFSGKPTEDIVLQKEEALRSALLSDGFKPKEGCLLARYNDVGRTWSFIMRNEVLIWLEDFTLE